MRCARARIGRYWSKFAGVVAVGMDGDAWVVVVVVVVAVRRSVEGDMTVGVAVAEGSAETLIVARSMLLQGRSLPTRIRGTGLESRVIEEDSPPILRSVE